MSYCYDDRYDDIPNTPDIYDSCPVEWITESGAYLDSLDAVEDEEWDDCDYDDDYDDDDLNCY